jgi:hypothetical protein
LLVCPKAGPQFSFGIGEITPCRTGPSGTASKPSTHGSTSVQGVNSQGTQSLTKSTIQNNQKPKPNICITTAKGTFHLALDDLSTRKLATGQLGMSQFSFTFSLSSRCTRTLPFSGHESRVKIKSIFYSSDIRRRLVVDLES